MTATQETMAITGSMTSIGKAVTVATVFTAVNVVCWLGVIYVVVKIVRLAWGG